jgi:hypothetical protein
MEKPVYVLHKEINELLKKTGLSIQILNGQMSEVKKTQSMSVAISYLQDNSKAVLELLEIDFTYYHEFSRLDFEKELIEKLKGYKHD